MADELLSQVQDLFEGQIDFEGQRTVEWISNSLIIVTGIIAFIAGYVKQDIYLSLFIGLGGAAITFLAVVPPWSFYNQHPLKWLPTARQSSMAVLKGGKGAISSLGLEGQVLTI